MQNDGILPRSDVNEVAKEIHRKWGCGGGGGPWRWGSSNAIIHFARDISIARKTQNASTSEMRIECVSLTRQHIRPNEFEYEM